MNKFRREAGMFLALCIMCLGLYLANDGFSKKGNVLDTIRQIAMLSTLGIGMAFVIITGGIDLSVGSIVGLTGVLIAKISSSNPDCCGVAVEAKLESILGFLHISTSWANSLTLITGITIALGIALLLGLIQGLLITRLDLQPFIVTLGGMLIFRGVSQTICAGNTLGWGSKDVPDVTQLIPDVAQNGLPALIWGPWDSREDWLAHLPHWLSGHFASSVLTWVNYVQIPSLIFLVTAIIGAYFLHFTVFGRYVFAIGGNREAARYSGVNVKRVETLTYVISAGLAGIAGVAYASYNSGQSQTNGVSYELYAIAGAVLGGCSLRGGEGSVIGILIGSSVIRLIHNGFNMFRYPLEKMIEWGTWLSSSSLGIVRGLGRLVSWMAGAGRTTVWHPDENWKEIVFGAVILIAVILDQVAHIIQAARRTRKVTPPPAAKTTETPVPPAALGPVPS